MYFSHMAAITIQELHDFAASVGINKCWFSNKRGKKQPHYDVIKYRYTDCVENGAIECSSAELFNMLKTTY